MIASVDEPSFLIMGGLALWLRMEHRLTQVEDKLKVLEEKIAETPNKTAAENTAQKEKSK